MIIYVVVLKMIMMPSCPYFILSTPISLNMWTYFLISTFAWGQARSKLGGVDTSILHHAFILIFTALWAVITHYITILMYILSYFRRFTWRGRMPTAGILGWKRSKYWRPILHNSKSPETSWRIFLEYIKNIGQRKRQRGHQPATRVEGMPPTLWAPRQASGAHLWLYGVFWPGKKIRRKLSGLAAAVSRRKPI